MPGLRTICKKQLHLSRQGSNKKHNNNNNNILSYKKIVRYSGINLIIDMQALLCRKCNYLLKHILKVPK